MGTGADMSEWLVAIAVIAGTNPARLAPALPRGDRDRSERVLVTAFGSVIAAVVLAVLVAAGGSVAGWLEVSAPTFAVAAGLVLVLAAIGQAVRAPHAEPSRPGRGAALVPVAVPFVLRPEVGLLCLAAGAGSAEVGAMIGLIGAVLGTVVGAWVDADGTTLRVTAWTARLLEVAAVAAGIAITVDGVVAV